MRTPALCATIAAADMATLVRRRDLAVEADLVELRLDGVDAPDPRAALHARPRPAIVTCRAAWEGGQFGGSEDERERLLTEALVAGADFVDVEWNAPFRDRLLARDPGRVVVSRHWFDAVPADLADVAKEMRRSGAGVVKLAIPAARLADCLPLLALGRLAGPHERLALVAMGPGGVVTRILAARMGSCWTYAGDLGAVGQLEVGRLAREFRFHALGRHTRVFGVVGRGASYSPSLALHNAAFDATGLDAACVPFEAATLADFLDVARAFDVEGVEIAAPFHEGAWTTAGVLDPDARRSRVVTSLRREASGGWAGRNTAVGGFLGPLSGVQLNGRRAAVLGAGTAARGVVVALGSRGARVTVHARRPERAREVAALVDGDVAPLPPTPGSWDVLVQATPVGGWPDVVQSLVPADAAQGGLVYDLVCNPPETSLIRAARANGCAVIEGRAMLVARAALDFAWWTGIEAPAPVMARVARRGAGVISGGRDGAAAGEVHS